MDFVHEAVGLGVNLLVLGICVKEYVGHKKTVQILKNAPQLNIDSELKQHVASQPKKTVPYAVIRGTVAPIGRPIRSVLTPSVTGVLQVVKLNENIVARGFAGFWAEQNRLVHMTWNDVAFELKGKKEAVEIIDALAATVIDMDTVYNNYEPATLTFLDHVFGFFSGIRQKGLQTTEEMLRDGSFITAIGELELDGNKLHLKPSTMGPMLLTTATKASLIRKFESAKSLMLLRIFICGTISAVLLFIIGRKIYRKKKHERENARIKETIEKEMRNRRARNRSQNLNQDQLCVICLTNPKEIIILPCGHFCMCEDCAQKVVLHCPICRGNISSKSAAFMS